MNLNHYMKIQNAYGTRNRREKELWKVNHSMEKHFNDTFDTEEVLLNGEPFNLMIVRDTEGNVHKKKIKSKHGDKFKLGDYVEWNGQHWLITLIEHDDKTWNRGYMFFCPILLRWQNSNGKIIERWGYSEDFTKYATGTDGNKTITMGEYQYGITLPVDDETKFLKRDRRFPIDLEGVEPPDVYKLTNRKILLTDASSYKRGGVLTLTLSFDVFDSANDKKIEMDDGSEVWICDYVEIPDNKDEPNGSWRMKIYAQNYMIRANGIQKEITAQLFDADGIKIENDIVYEWDIQSEALDYIDYSVNDNKLFLSVSNKCEMFGETINISCMSKYTGQSDTITLTVQEVF